MTITVESHQKLLTVRTYGNNSIHFRYTKGTKTPDDILAALRDKLYYDPKFGRAGKDNKNNMDLSFDKKEYYNIKDKLTMDDKFNLMDTSDTIHIINKMDNIRNHTKYTCDKKCCNYKKGDNAYDLTRIYILTLTGKQITIDNMKSCNTIIDLMEKIQDKEGIPPFQQRIIFNNTQLYYNCTLEHYNIVNNAQLHLVLRLYGGMHAETSGKDGYKPLKENTFYDLDLDEIIELE